MMFDDVSSRLDKVIKEAIQVKDLLDDDSFRDTSEFQLLIRVLNEQTYTDENGEVTAKDKSEIKSTSLQNPSDPDATVRTVLRKMHVKQSPRGRHMPYMYPQRWL